MKIGCMIFIVLVFGLGQIFAAPCGDVNSDGSIDIVDALLIAQYYVGLNPSNFDSTAADVNGDGSIDIVDALLVAQLYVGLLNEFPCGDTPTPVPTNPTEITPDPTDPPTSPPTSPPNVIDCSNAPVWTADAIYDTAGMQVQ